MVERQGGDLAKLKLDAPFLKSRSQQRADGFFADADALAVGQIVRDLGAGRKVKGDPINPNVGVLFSKDLGERVAKGEVLATVYAQSQEDLDRAVASLEEVLVVGPKPYDRPVVLDVIRGGDE